MCRALDCRPTYSSGSRTEQSPVSFSTVCFPPRAALRVMSAQLGGSLRPHGPRRHPQLLPCPSAPEEIGAGLWAAPPLLSVERRAAVTGSARHLLSDYGGAPVQLRWDGWKRLADGHDRAQVPSHLARSLPRPQPSSRMYCRFRCEKPVISGNSARRSSGSRRNTPLTTADPVPDGQTGGHKLRPIRAETPAALGICSQEGRNNLGWGGDNGRGQLGDGTTTHRHAPIQVGVKE